MSSSSSESELELEEREVQSSQYDTWAYRFEPLASSEESNTEEPDLDQPERHVRDIGRPQNNEW